MENGFAAFTSLFEGYGEYIEKKIGNSLRQKGYEPCTDFNAAIPEVEFSNVLLSEDGTDTPLKLCMDFDEKSGMAFLFLKFHYRRLCTKNFNNLDDFAGFLESPELLETITEGIQMISDGFNFTKNRINVGKENIA